MATRRKRDDSSTGKAPPPGRRVARAIVRRVRDGRQRVRLDNDARRAQLLELGMKVFSEKTYDEVSIDDLARAAGISKGLLYHYFPTKRDLYLAGLRTTAAELLARTDVSAIDASPIERVRHGIDAYLSFVAERKVSYVSLMRGGIGSDPEVLRIVEDVRAALVERMFDGPGSPLAIGDHRTPLARAALRGWLGFAEAASLEWLTHPDLEQATIRDLLVDMLLPTLRLALGFSLSRTW
ncbi:MAG: TetR/AcrR family transcriptional regulator [Kofleriaceae bacterium]|nr:TetR/AcrR family transcriptional regulator [Myxococcales bacterium]MCB9562986.1 TetR/AcrR family transcriptional regulator [Kofleriaceae bacterium]